jgi:hypothetical protein
LEYYSEIKSIFVVDVRVKLTVYFTIFLRGLFGE